MKTTIEIADGLFEEAKARAAESGISFRELVERSLRKILMEPSPKAKRVVRDRRFQGEGLQPDVSWDEIIERSYDLPKL